MPLTIEVHVSGDLLGEALRGGERHGLDLARALRDRGHRVRLFCRGQADTADAGTRDGFEVIRLSAPPPPPLLWRLARLLMIRRYAAELRVRRQPVDVVIALSPWLALASRRVSPRCPVVYVATDLLCASSAFDRGETFTFPAGGWWPLGLDAWLERRAFEASAHVVLCAHWMRDGLAAAGVASRRMTVIHPGASVAAATVTRAEARRQLQLPDGAFVVIYVGGLTMRKNVGVLIDAVRAAPPDVHVAIVGDGPEAAALRERAHRQQVADRVHFLGWLSDPSVAYAAADALCHPARYETYGLVYPEAMLNGIAVVAPRHQPPQVYSTAPELIRDREDGVLFDALRADDLAARLTELATRRDRAQAIGAQGQRTAATITWRAYADAFEPVLASVTAQPGVMTAVAAGRAS